MDASMWVVIGAVSIVYVVWIVMTILNRRSSARHSEKISTLMKLVMKELNKEEEENEV